MNSKRRMKQMGGISANGSSCDAVAIGQAITAKYGAPDILVNNAGITKDHETAVRTRRVVFIWWLIERCAAESGGSCSSWHAG